MSTEGGQFAEQRGAGARMAVGRRSGVGASATALVLMVAAVAIPMTLSATVRAEGSVPPAEPPTVGPLVASNIADLSSSWTVPAGVEVVQLVATGASGGGSQGQTGTVRLGGPGCQAFGSVPVSKDQVITAVVGTKGGNGSTTLGTGTGGYDFAGGAGGTGAFAGGDGGQAWATGSNTFPLSVSTAGGGGGGGATGIKIDGTYAVAGTGGGGAGGDSDRRQNSACGLSMYPRHFGDGGLPSSSNPQSEGGVKTDYTVSPPVNYPELGGSFSNFQYFTPCVSGTRTARPGGNGGPVGAGVGGKGGDAGWTFLGGSCTTPYTEHSGRPGGGGGGGWKGGGGGASSTDGNLAGAGAPGTNLAPRTATESADFKTAPLGGTGAAEVRWVTIDSTLPAEAAVPGSVVSTTLAATFGDGTPYVISLGNTASWTWSATNLPTGWTINATTGVLAGTVPAGEGVTITVTADYKVSSFTPWPSSYGNKTVAKSSRKYRIGPAAPLLPTVLTYTGATGTVDKTVGYVLSSTVAPADCTGTVQYTVTDSSGTVMNGPAAASTLDVSGWADGVYTVTASYAEDASCNAATVSATFTIATPGVGTPVSVTATSVTVGYGELPTIGYTDTGFTGSDDWAIEPMCAVFTQDEPPLEVIAFPVPAGTYDIICAGGDPGEGYRVSGYTTGTLTIEAADPVCTVIGYDVGYDASDHTAVGQCVGVGAEVLAGLDLSGTTNKNVGSYGSDPWTFTDETGNYNDDAGTVANRISKATPTLSYTGISGLVTPGVTGVLSVTVSPSVCTGTVTYKLTKPDGSTVDPLTSGFSTTGWAPGIYTITATYPEDAYCATGTDEVLLVVGSPGDSTTGGGRYKVNPSISGSPRVNFGYTVQKTVKIDKRTNLTTTTHRGELLWINSQGWRVKARVDSSVVTNSSGAYVSGDQPGFVNFASCPVGVGSTSPDSKPKCGAISAIGILQRYNAVTGGWDTILTGDVPARVYVTATVYDGGQMTVCKLKRCTVTDLADWFGLQISGVSVSNQVPVGAPTKLDNAQNGQIVIRSN